LTRSVPEELLKVKKIKEEPKWENITSFMKEVSEGTQNKDKKALKNIISRISSVMPCAALQMLQIV
jgi:hypothetical protein